MELIAEKVDGAVVLNISSICVGQEHGECRTCVDIGGLVHNWLLQTELGYLVVDFHDAKYLCSTFLVELILLHKRLRIPFLFVGVMENPHKILDDYAFSASGYPVFNGPEEAADYLKEHHAPLIEKGYDASRMNFGEAIVSYRSRQSFRASEEDEEIEADDL